MFGVIAASNRRYRPESNFTTVWETTTANESITIPLIPTSNYDIMVNWGDGANDTYTGLGSDLDVSHTYSSASEYTVRITGLFKGVKFGVSDESNRAKIKEVKSWGRSQWDTLQQAFYFCPNLVITAEDILNTSNVPDFREAFSNCVSLTDIPNIGKWNISNIVNISSMFRGAELLNPNIVEWQLPPKVVTISNLFRNTSFNRDISHWDVTNVTQASAVFLGTPFNQDISSWNVGNIGNMNAMFFNSAFNQDISNWDVSSASDMSLMFRDTPFNQDISSWNISNVSNMSNFMDGVTLDPQYLTNMYNVWSQLNLKPNVSANFGDSKYFVEADPAKQSIINNSNWTIIDGGIAA